MVSPILETSWENAPRGSDLHAALQEHLGIHLRGVISDEDCARYSQGIYKGRVDWNSDFGGEQFSLGRAWYTHLEQGKSREYFARADESNRIVERYVPGLAARMRDQICDLVGLPAVHRRGWCGPGVHIFPAKEWVAQHGGVIHSDLEGLTETHVEEQAPALSLVLMLQSPEEGGGLRIWDRLHLEDDSPDADQLIDIPYETVDYKPGDLVVFDSYRLHQIQPFDGTQDRISMTAHIALFTPEQWSVWF